MGEAGRPLTLAPLALAPADRGEGTGGRSLSRISDWHDLINREASGFWLWIRT
jgi:hypothetical protein